MSETESTPSSKTPETEEPKTEETKKELIKALSDSESVQRVTKDPKKVAAGKKGALVRKLKKEQAALKVSSKEEEEETKETKVIKHGNIFTYVSYGAGVAVGVVLAHFVYVYISKKPVKEPENKLYMK